MKQCPICKTQYPDSCKYCNHDGSNLTLINNNTKSNNNNISIIILSCIATITAIILLINIFPYLVKTAVSNCEITLTGISFKDDSPSVVNQAKDMFDSFFGGEKKENKDIPQQKEHDILLILKIKNDNYFSATLTKLDITLYINNKKIGNGELHQNKSYKIKARNKVTLEFPLTVSLWQLMSSSGSIIMSEEISYKVKGNAIIKTLVGSFDFPVNVEGINIPISY